MKASSIWARSAIAIALSMTLHGCFLEGDDGQNGIDGAAGQDGADGTNGSNGTNGTDASGTTISLSVLGRYSFLSEEGSIVMLQRLNYLY